MNVINIEIKNKKAYRTNDTVYICDNSKYTVVFSFDEEWNEFEAKTARFVYGDKYQDVVFTGNECAMPIISNTKLISVGVFAGHLHTTTPALVVAEKSILSGAGVPDEPTPDVYGQIVDLCSEAVKTAKGVEERANNGEFDGEDGKDGVDGHTPVKGTDYWTPEDKEEIVNEVLEHVDVPEASNADQLLSLKYSTEVETFDNLDTLSDEYKFKGAIVSVIEEGWLYYYTGVEWIMCGSYIDEYGFSIDTYRVIPEHFGQVLRLEYPDGNGNYIVEYYQHYNDNYVPEDNMIYRDYVKLVVDGDLSSYATKTYTDTSIKQAILDSWEVEV